VSAFVVNYDIFIMTKKMKNNNQGVKIMSGWVGKNRKFNGTVVWYSLPWYSRVLKKFTQCAYGYLLIVKNNQYDIPIFLFLNY